MGITFGLELNYNLPLPVFHYGCYVSLPDSISLLSTNLAIYSSLGAEWAGTV